MPSTNEVLGTIETQMGPIIFNTIKPFLVMLIDAAKSEVVIPPVVKEPAIDVARIAGKLSEARTMLAEAGALLKIETLSVAGPPAVASLGSAPPAATLVFPQTSGGCNPKYPPETWGQLEAKAPEGHKLKRAGTGEPVWSSDGEPQYVRKPGPRARTATAQPPHLSIQAEVAEAASGISKSFEQPSAQTPFQGFVQTGTTLAP